MIPQRGNFCNKNKNTLNISFLKVHNTNKQIDRAFVACPKQKS